MSDSFCNSLIELDPSALDSDSVFAPDANEVIDLVPENGAQSQTVTSRTVTVSGRKRKASANSSWVWTYFQKCDGHIICSQCPSKKRKLFSINTGNSSLKRHLEVSHKLKQDGKTGDPTQSILDLTGKVVDPMAMDAQEKADILKSLVEFVVDNKQPFQLVESKSFSSFCMKMNRKFPLPSRRTFVRALHDEYAEALQNFLSQLERIPGRVALTLDGWSSRIMKGYMVVTVHWVDETWSLKNAVLEFKYFPRPHNQHTTSDLIISILKEFNLHTRVRAITSDSGGEMVPAMKLVQSYLNRDLSASICYNVDFHMRCVCHVINRAVVDATALIKREVGMLRDLLKMIRGSGIMRQKYSDLSVLLGRATKQVVPNLDVETRWNSMFLMVDDCFKNKDILESVCNQEEFIDKLGPLKLSEMDWRVLKSSKDFLESAYLCTKAASGQTYVTLAMQPLIYRHLRCLCESTIAGTTATGFTTPTVKAAAEAMLTKLQKYRENLNNNTANIALFLDPRRTSSDASAETKTMIRNLLVDEYGYSPAQQDDNDAGGFNLFAATTDSQDISTDEVEDSR
jgi:hypothetical protein